MSLHNNLIKIAYKANSEHYFLCFAGLEKQVWLDSGKPSSTYGRYDILSAAPVDVLENPSIEAIEARVESMRTSVPDEIRQNPYLPFVGGAIGYLNYEFNSDDFGISSHKGLRNSHFGFYHWALIQDHKQKTATLVFLSTCSEAFKSNIIALASQTPPETAPLSKPQTQPEFSVSGFHANLSKQKYLNALDTIMQHILVGNCYQINFSQRFSGEFSGDPKAAYLALRKILPSPFSAFIGLSDDSILSLSPERFIQIDAKNKAKTQPIKGTAPRGLTPEDDAELAKGLQSSEKNRAENLMIVDLLRNDFSKSCEPFSVKVPKLFDLESFANVHHLVSTIEGKIETGISALEFFIRCFPGGSITGAPKKRAMEIIRDLEEHPRNIYCGSVCYLSANGNFDSNISIRTLLVSENKIYCWGGGGIVADSNPEDEYQESLQKIGVLIEALQ